MGTKQNPGPYDCYVKLAPDEPYFVLRAKDATAPRVVREWVRQRRLEAAVTGAPITPEYGWKLDEALRCADEMERWKQEHP